MDYLTGSIFPLNYGTSIHAFKQRAELKEDDNVLIMGAAGGLGISAIHVAKAMGARVIAAASEDEKLHGAKRQVPTKQYCIPKILAAMKTRENFPVKLKK